MRFDQVPKRLMSSALAIRCERAVAFVFGALVFSLLNTGSSTAQDRSRIPPTSVYQAMLKANKPAGWIQFRNFNGKQYIYFTALQTLHCRLTDIRFSVNSTLLDQSFALVPCNPALPMSLPSDARLHDIAIALPPGSAEMVAVQVTWEDGSSSEMALYRPCPNVGDQTCALPMQ